MSCGEQSIQIPAAVEDANDLNPVVERNVKDEVFVEMRNPALVHSGEFRVPKILGAPQPRHSAQQVESFLNGRSESFHKIGIDLLKIVVNFVQIPFGGSHDANAKAHV